MRLPRRQAGLRSDPAWDAAILEQRAAAVLRQTPGAALVTATNAALMTAVLVRAQHDTRAWWWLLAVMLSALLRVAIWQMWRRSALQSEQARGWAAAGAFGTFVSGLLWGAGSVLLAPHSPTYQLFWVFLIGGMCAGAAALHAAHLPTVIGFIMPASLPTAIRLAADGSQQGVAGAAMIVVFLVALTATARRASLQFGDMFRLRLALEQRTRDLDASNARLQQEMAEHRATEEVLRHAQKMEAIGQLTGGIAHDFNNLLTAVLGSLELLRGRIADDDVRSTRLLDTGLAAARKGAALTQRLLAFSRRQALQPESVDVPALVRSMSGLLQSSLGQGIAIETQFPISPTTAFVDAGQLELALLNLAVNARDAMPRGGRLTISVREETVGPAHNAGLAIGCYVVLSVADTGEGMDEAILSRATEPFFTTKDVGKGTGLGLSMAYGLASQSGGWLSLRSRKDVGTTVELWLRRAEMAAVLSGPTARMHEPARKLSVLLVDDDPLVLTSAAALLEELGHAVVEAVSGGRAMEIVLAGAEFDLVITDYSMPGMTGLQVAQELGRLRPLLPVLLATGYIEAEEPIASHLPRLIKPFGRRELVRAMRDCLGPSWTIVPEERPAESGSG